MEKNNEQDIGQFTLLNIIYQSKTFVLYQSRNNQNGDLCYLEKIFPTQICSDNFSAKFLERADLLSILEHPNLLNITGYGKDDDGCYIIFEPFKGKLLSEIQEIPQSEKECAHLACEVASGLRFLDEQDLCHGNISPESVLVGLDGSVKIVNFGFTDLIIEEVKSFLPENAVGISIGVPGFIAPEQISGDAPNSSVDVYAIGALFYWLINKRIPYFGSTSFDSIMKEVTSNLIWPEKEIKISSSSLRLIYRCMAKEPRDRLANVSIVEGLLRRISRGKRPNIRISKRLMEGVPKQPPRLLVGIISLVIIIIGGWISFVKESFQTSDPPVVSQPIITITLPAINDPELAANATEPAAPLEIIAATVEPIAIYQPVLINTPFPNFDQPILLQNVLSIKEIGRIGTGKPIQAAWAPDNSNVAIATTAGVYILNSGTIIQFIDPGDSATSVAFSLDGDLIAIGLMKGEIQLWNWKTRELKFELIGHSAQVSRMVFSSNRRFLFSASYDLNIKIWEISSGTEVKNVPAHPLPVKDIALSEDGRILASGSADHLVKIWDCFTWEKITEFQNTSDVEAVAVSLDGTYVAAGGSDGLINQWHIQSRQLRGDPIPVQSKIWNLKYSIDGKELWVGLDDGGIKDVSALPKKYLWEQRRTAEKPENKALMDIFGATFDFASDVAISQDFNSFAAITWKGGVEINKQSNGSFTRYDDYDRVFFSPDSRYLLVGGKNISYFLMELPGNKILLSGNMKVPTGNPFSPTSDRFVLIKGVYIQRDHGRIPVYVEQVSIHQISSNTEGFILGETPLNSSVQFVQDGTLLASGTINQTKMWDSTGYHPVFLREGPDSGCQVIRSTNNDEILSITSQIGVLSTWDEFTQEICAYSAQYFGRLATFSSDRKWYGFINSNGLLEIMDLENGSTVLRTSLDQKPAAMVFSPDNSLFVMGFNNGSLKFWSTVDGTLIQTLSGHYGPVRALAFSPNGKMIASSSSDGTVRIWGILSE